MGRQDSISFYTNLGSNGPRFSTDSNSSISNFLNFNDQAAYDANGRGLSVINNLFLPPQPSGSQQQASSFPADYNTYSTLRRPSEQLEPFNPSVKLKMPSFSKKNSVAFPTGSSFSETSDFDLFGKRDSLKQTRQSSFLNTNIGDGSDFDLFAKRDSINKIADDESPLDTKAKREARSEPDVGKSHMKIIPELGQINDENQAQRPQFRTPNIPNFDYGTQLRPGQQQVQEYQVSPLDQPPMRSPTSDTGTAASRRNAVPVLKSKTLSPPPQQQQQQQQHQPQFTEDSKKLVPVQETAVREDGRPLLGATKVDQLMLVIQARKKGIHNQIPQASDGSILDNGTGVLPQQTELVGGIDKPKTKAPKHHECSYCHKTFTQSTHLEVHVRSHIGYKPFECTYCGKRFTQGGNLRTHLRLHTGEKPYVCETCGRQFSRKGNLAAHKLTHENLKPFECKLDNCNKAFTQLGNLKAHQNRFHLNTLNELTKKLAEMDPTDENIKPEERELLNYFAQLYKNSNRGIKGRGKKVTPAVDTTEGQYHGGDELQGGQQGYGFNQGYQMNGNTTRDSKNIEFKNVNFQQ
jgi:DNA-directed RNA polymerase subunit RPC12/RpoP